MKNRTNEVETWHQLLIKRNNSPLKEQIRVGRCNITWLEPCITCNNNSILFEAFTYGPHEELSSIWKSKTTIFIDERLYVLYKYESRKEGSIRFGIMKFLLEEKDNGCIEGWYWDSDKQDGSICIYKDEDEIRNKLKKMGVDDLDFFPYDIRPEINRDKVFISYCHSDKEWLGRIRIHIKPYENKGIIESWDDTKIKAGSRWKDEIKKALNSAKVAVFLVSADFLASDFITENELKPLLVPAQNEGTIILPIIVKPCAYPESELAPFQPVNSPSQPLCSMTEFEQEHVLVKVAQRIKEVLKNEY